MKKDIGQQQGNVSLFMVVVLITIGLLLIQSLSFFQTRSQGAFRKEIQYFSAFNKAESALAWGLTLQWANKLNGVKHWVCQKQEIQQWKSCLKHYKGTYFVLSGQSHYRLGEDITVYRWVTFDINKQQFFPREKGWLDYCPVVKKGFCQ